MPMSEHQPAAEDDAGSAERAQALSPSIPSNRVPLRPGAYRVFPRGAGRPTGVEEAAAAREIRHNDNGQDVVVYEGFLPRPTPEEVIRLEAEEMLRSAITLDESAVRVIDDVNDDNGPAVETGGEGMFKKCWESPVPLTVMTLLLLAAIGLGVAYGGAWDTNEASSSSATPLGEEEESCIGTVHGRYKHAVLLLSNITPMAILEDRASAQGRALRWIVCCDLISSALIDGRDLATGLLPRQAHGTRLGRNAGEAQVRRRYALATYFFATSEEGPWENRLNFLSPDVHECSWHHNYTRSNWPYGDLDPAGIICFRESDLSDHDNEQYIVLDDAESAINEIHFNFRVANNLSGTIPPELGTIDDICSIMLEQQEGLYGSLPATIGYPSSLRSIAILFMGPHFGGVLPPSLFTNPSLEWISIRHVAGAWEFPPAIHFKSGDKHRLLGLTVSSELAFAGKEGKGGGMSGTLPSYISELRNLKVVNFAGGSLEGTIPDSLGSLGALEFLNLHGNNLSGTLPPSLEGCSSLTAAAFAENNFRGLLPSWLGNWSDLRLLDLSYNQFEGTLPETFSRLSSLEHISLQHNKNLTGAIAAFEPLNRLSSLILHSNHFSSSIPEGLFFNFTDQIFADFGHNSFTGTLPQTFSERAANISYLATMSNNFDADDVDDVICEQVPVFLADCSSACSTHCCSKDSTDQNQRYCNFDLDFYRLTNLACGEWWMYCLRGSVSYDPEPVDDLN